jgi:hypothetical protein
MSGVSTTVWGPPLWRILHTISFAQPDALRHAAPAVLRFLTNLARVLPCKWCRDSYAEFLSDMPDLRATIQNGQLAPWMYNLHARVNNKLGVSTPKFEAIAKRFKVRPVQWMASDVWDTISLFGLNFTPHNRDAYRIFWDSWPPMLTLGDGADPRVASLLRNTPCPCEDGAFIATCLVLEAAHQGHPPPDSRRMRDRTQKYAAARAAGACASGVCE